MGYSWAVAVEENADGIEAQGVEFRRLFDEVLFCHRADGPLFAWGYGLERVAEAGGASELDLDYYQGPVLAGDDVQFAVAGAIVLVDDGVSPVFEEAAREPLAARSAGAVVQVATPA